MTYLRRLFIAAAVLALGGLVAALVIGGSAWSASDLPLSDPGPVTAWGLPTLRLANNVAVMAMIGFAISAAFLAPTGKNVNKLSDVGRLDLHRAGNAGFVSAGLSVLLIWFTTSDLLAIPPAEALLPDVFLTYALAIGPNVSYVFMAAIGMTIGIGSRFTTSFGVAGVWSAAALLSMSLPALHGHNAAMGDHALGVISGMAHAIAASLWIGGLIALSIHAARADRSFPLIAARFSNLALISVIILIISGIANAWSRMTTPTQLFTTGYGQLLTLKILLLLAVLALAAYVRQRIMVKFPSIPTSLKQQGQPTQQPTSSLRSLFLQLVGFEVLLLAIVLGISTALTRTANPAPILDLPSYGEVLLSFTFLDEVSVGNILTTFAPNATMVAFIVVAGGLYAAGVVAVRRRGIHWSFGRTTTWYLGLLMIVAASGTGMHRYGMMLFSVHMLAHMTLSMMAPILLVLGAPVTLALRALHPAPHGQRGAREWIVWAIHSPYGRFLANPMVAFLIYTISLYGLYFTSLFDYLMRSMVGHAFMELHFLAAGFLFYWVIIGVDPSPKPIPYWGKLLTLIASLGFHSFFAIAIMSATESISPDWYVLVRPPWLSDVLADQYVGGGFAWALGEIPTVIVLIALGIQWARSDEREAKRKDRQADRSGDAELKAYNEHLAKLAAYDKRMGE